MDLSIHVKNINTQKDVAKIKRLISQYQGIMACEISINKKEIQLVYDEISIAIEDIINEIEINGYICN